MVKDTIEITLKLPVQKAIAVLEFIRGREDAETTPEPTAPVAEFRALLDAESSKLVSFFVEKGGTAYNSDLATALGFGEDARRTSNALTRITYRLRKI